MSAVRFFALACGVAAWLSACGRDGVIDLLPSSPDGATSLSDGASVAPSTRDSGSDGPADADAAAPCDASVCPCGLTDCGGTCVDIANDPNHCGGCFSPVSHYQFCANGQKQCLPGFTPCGGACVDTTSNPDHCGGCVGPVCASGEKCENGSCSTGACGGGLTGCPVAGNRIACVDLSKGEPYCGDCSTVCGPDQVCVANHCQPYAPATPCTTCPCTQDCQRTEGSPSTCCPGFPQNTSPICVHGSACP